MADGRHFKNCYMQYLGNYLTDFDEICMAKRISRSNPIGDQKFENLKIENPRLQAADILKIKT